MLDSSKANHVVLSGKGIIKKYSIFIAFLPIFGIYASGIPGFNAGEIGLLIFTTICLFKSITGKKRYFNKKPTKIFKVLIAYLIFSTLISILIQNNSMQNNFLQPIDIFIRTTRFSFYIICLIITSRHYFNIEIASKWVIRISIAASIYIIIQYIAFNFFHILLKGHVSFIPIYSAEIYGEFTYNITNFYRPTSFFLEPSHLVQYTVIGLILILFSKKVSNKNDLIKAIIISIGMILSTSVQGLVVIAIVWSLWVIRLAAGRLNIKNIFLFIFFASSLPIISISIYNTPIVKNTLSRLMDGSNIFTSNAFLARFQGYSYFENVPSILKFIGLGYGSIPSNDIFMSSIAYVLYGGGYIGLAITLLLFFRLYVNNKNTISKVIIIVSVILLTATEWIYVYISVYYFSFICFGNILNESKEDRPLNKGFLRKNRSLHSAINT